MFNVVDNLDDPVMHEFLAWVRLFDFPGDDEAMMEYI
jgi:hypothetical protein